MYNINQNDERGQHQFKYHMFDVQNTAQEAVY